MQLEMALFLLLITFCLLGFYVYLYLWLQPEKIRKQLLRQGIRGHKPSFFFGNMLDMKKMNTIQKVETDAKVISHEFRLYPCFDHCREEYGPIFSYLIGNTVTVYVADPNLVKEIASCTSLNLGRGSYRMKNRGALHGEGIVSVNGQKWVHHRKIIAPEFFQEKVKVCRPVSISSAKIWRF